MTKLNLDIENHLPPISPPCRSPLEENVPAASYTKLSEIIRKSANSQFQCSVFCGGKKCKYESAKNWSDQERAISVIYSNWITEDILAMSRPNTQMINQHKLIELFQSNQIKTVINLQEPGEHNSCGPALDPSGFSYDPKVFMDNQIYFYNFHWKDHCTLSVGVLLDIVKVILFSLSQGKIAVHCHAGLGRTGVLIAAYLIYAYRCQAQNAIKFVRLRRPNSIQSKAQILSLFTFANYISPCFIVYNRISSKHQTTKLSDFLQRQNVLLHGLEKRCLRYIPKIIFVICEKMAQIADKRTNHQIADSTAELENFTQTYLSSKNPEKIKDLIEKIRNKSIDSIVCEDSLSSDPKISEDAQTRLNRSTEFASISPDTDDSYLLNENEIETLNNYSDLVNLAELSEVNKTLNVDEDLFSKRHDSIIQTPTMKRPNQTLPLSDLIAMITDSTKVDPIVNNYIFDFQKEINNKPSGWERLYNEDSIKTLAILLWEWFENLDVPIFNTMIISSIVDAKQQHILQTFSRFDTGTRYTLEYIIRFIMTITEGQHHKQKNRLIARFVAALTIKQVRMDNGELIPKEKIAWTELAGKSKDRIFNFISEFADIICTVSPVISKF